MHPAVFTAHRPPDTSLALLVAICVFEAFTWVLDLMPTSPAVVDPLQTLRQVVIGLQAVVGLSVLCLAAAPRYLGRTSL